ncbi:nucleoside phosphorylase [Flagellimonas halotolerans]|uniref:Uridine phosphorylase n=1 Tax=Flagellimonas halotolerans TaxID=3112164 RepID=A0ABU6IN47_9FLAO|nr:MULTISPECIES: nucleoside phosphorylase [unclassified Allomuricauda]MEC3964590.1 nucleoside phosphorylase [Muricauda sp. SYSU M86414]MEC4264459.1 nucleoside phosphorylase [Muricauda sp. SYSU M84420]
MGSSLGSSELILNPDGSIYHLNLLPDDIATTIITVGDPERVREVSKYFDSIEMKKSKREFVTHTGYYSGKRISVISTGIGTDNIDIVFNELDALANIDFQSRQIKSQKKQLSFIRVGTSGSLQPDIPVDSFLMSSTGIGLDNLLHFYDCGHIKNKEMEQALAAYLNWSKYNIHPYAVDFDKDLADIFTSNRIRLGLTATNSGFYGPQGRVLRLNPAIADFNEKLAGFSFGDLRITNLEMETAAIYGIAKLHGHRAVSLNAILANRATGEFSKQGHKAVHELIQYTLERIAKSHLI